MMASCLFCVNQHKYTTEEEARLRLFSTKSDTNAEEAHHLFVWQDLLKLFLTILQVDAAHFTY